MQSTSRAISRGNTYRTYNPDTEQVEDYKRSKRGSYLRAGESLAIEQLHARHEQYRARFEELAEIKRKEEIKGRARKLDAEQLKAKLNESNK